MAKKSTSCICVSDNDVNGRYLVYEKNGSAVVAENVLFDDIAEAISDHMEENEFLEDDVHFTIYKEIDVDIEIVIKPQVSVTRN